MANHRFRFSNMIPNSWFYQITGNKVKNKITKTQPITTSSSSSSVSSVPSSQPAAIDQRKSYYFTRELTVPNPTRIQDPLPPETHPPRKSSKKKRPTTSNKPISQKLVSSELSPRIITESVETDSDVLSHDQPCSCSCKISSINDDVCAKVELPRIVTKAVNNEEFGSGKWVVNGGSRRSLSVRVAKERIMGISETPSPVRKVKGNGYSPRLGNRVRVNRINGGRRRNGNRRSLSESMAVVKTSVDPGRDFKESMVEMIKENNMKSTKDLEDLLACYLALNSDEYHDLIIKVFKQIWFETSDIKLL